MTANLDPAREAALLADAIEAAAFSDLFAAAPAALRDQLGLRTETLDGATALLAPGLPSTQFNRVIGLGNTQPATTQALARLQTLYRAAGVGSWWLHLNPVCADPSLRSMLTPQFTAPARHAWAKLLRAATEPPPVESALTIAPAASLAQAEEAGARVAEAFGMPPFIAHWIAALHDRAGWRVYAVRDQAQVVGGACLFVADATGWLGMGAVVEGQRRRGGQQGAIARRIADAAAIGCTRLVTETGEPIAGEHNPSLANLLRCGFTRVASRLNFEHHTGGR